MRILMFMCLIALAGSMVNCESDTYEPLKPLDLMQYGMPITIMAPDSAEVKSGTLVMMKDVTVKKGEDFYIQIFSSETNAGNVKKILAEQKSDIWDHPHFSKIIEEEEDGFIYETQLDSTNASYGFRYVKVKGDREYIFQSGLIGMFTLEDAKRMYKAVRGEEE